MTIVEFLEARIAEDEASANAAIRKDRHADLSTWEVYSDTESEDGAHWTTTYAGQWGNVHIRDTHGFDGLLDHIARHDPARVLRECAAKRALLDCGPSSKDWPNNYLTWRETLSTLAAIYSDHPDFDEGWFRAQ